MGLKWCLSVRAHHVQHLILQAPGATNTERLVRMRYTCRESPRHAKALYRRGLNHAILGDYEAARADFNAAKEADASIVPEVDRELTRMKHRQRNANHKEREQFRNFYARNL